MEKFGSPCLPLLLSIRAIILFLPGTHDHMQILDCCIMKTPRIIRSQDKGYFEIINRLRGSVRKFSVGEFIEIPEIESVTVRIRDSVL